MPPVFLDLVRVLRIHKSMIDEYGGAEGLRDAGLLDSAVSTPRATYDGGYLHSDLFDMAAAYLFHIVRNHPFVDGNKRTGAAAAIIFLDLNGVSVRADEDGLVDITMRVAEGKAGKQDIANFFRKPAE